MIWSGWGLWHINHSRLFNAISSSYVYIKYDLVGLALWHINHCRLFNTKSSSYIYIKYIWFGLVGVYGISTIVGYLMPYHLHTYILNMIWFGWGLWHINHCRLFSTKSPSYIYIKYIWFGLVGVYGISTIVGYLMPYHLHTYILNMIWLGWLYGISTIVGYLIPNPLHTYILNIYDLVWLELMAYQP